MTYILLPILIWLTSRCIVQQLECNWRPLVATARGHHGMWLPSSGMLQSSTDRSKGKSTQNKRFFLKPDYGLSNFRFPSTVYKPVSVSESADFLAMCATDTSFPAVFFVWISGPHQANPSDLHAVCFPSKNSIPTKQTDLVSSLVFRPLYLSCLRSL